MATVKRTRGEKVIAFIEQFCVTPEGQHVGKPIRLEPFQKKFILEVYDNPFGTDNAYLSISRKNGKTSLLAALLLAHLIGPEAVLNSQIVSGARSKDQAAILFKAARKMIELSPELNSPQVSRIIPSGKRLLGIRKNVEYQALSAEGGRNMGLSPILAILDEVGQIKGPTDDFVSAVVTAQGAYEHPLLIAISTQAPTDADLFSIWIDSAKSTNNPRTVCHVYEAPPECALDDRAAWAASNPALGVFRSLRDMENSCQRAMEMPANENAFRNLNLNQRIDAVSPFVSKSVWDANGQPPNTLKGKKVWGGLDLSTAADLTALIFVSDEGDVESHFWLPKEGLIEKSRLDKVPYNVWEKQNFLHTTPGKAIRYEDVAEFMRGVFDMYDIQKIAFDRALFEHLKPWLVKANFSEDELEKFVPYGQGTLSMTPALLALETALLDEKLKHGKHPILEMCARNTRVIGESGARKFDKRKSRGRIDGMVALAMAVGVMPDVKPQLEPRISFY